MRAILLLALLLLSGCSVFGTSGDVSCSNESISMEPVVKYVDVPADAPECPPQKSCSDEVARATATAKGELENLQDMLRNNENLLPEVNFLDRVGKSGSDGIVAKYDKPVFLVGPGKSYWLKCTGSMRPTFDCNDYLVAYKPTSRWDVKVGDVIGFQSPDHDMIVIHRVIYKLGDEYVTRGDNSMQFKQDMNIDGKHFIGVDPYRPTFQDVEYKILGVVWQ